MHKPVESSAGKEKSGRPGEKKKKEEKKRRKKKRAKGTDTSVGTKRISPDCRWNHSYPLAAHPSHPPNISRDAASSLDRHQRFSVTSLISAWV